MHRFRFDHVISEWVSVIEWRHSFTRLCSNTINWFVWCLCLFDLIWFENSTKRQNRNNITVEMWRWHYRMRAMEFHIVCNPLGRENEEEEGGKKNDMKNKCDSINCWLQRSAEVKKKLFQLAHSIWMVHAKRFNYISWFFFYRCICCCCCCCDCCGVDGGGYWLW